MKSCCASPFKKMIVRTAEQAGSERCSGPGWVQCPASKQHREEHPSADRCPFLQESLVQYCSATPVSMYVPYSDSPHSRCGTDSHSYCETYISMVQTGNPPSDSHVTSVSVSEKPGVCYSHNHLWIDVHDDRSCHVGVDAFLATFLRDVERLSFVTSRPQCLPTAVMTVRGADLYLTYPERMQVTGVNAYLRVRPSNLTRHPYTLGWLFEGVKPDASRGQKSASADKALITGNNARQWLRQESRRLTDFVRTELTTSNNAGIATMTDGGMWSEDLIAHLTREQTLRVWNEFFSISAAQPAS